MMHITIIIEKVSLKVSQSAQNGYEAQPAQYNMQVLNILSNKYLKSGF
jgi:hypothetical protein